ncbi:aspartate/glutamate racemase family protein [Mariniflexile litorale]|uniref:Aspartate/glutamate racemase family protein n=1 Tax=Mariniflexile litorale TaxID=3045158 RepID=A0AAU7ED25_9FLAO|nr:aspartate/glutamate racemase family protein [Mariniflexile sp. KMM 9835]MDQ8212957.1 hypothetical protein [Mariniflexile sp. KMM 9835]
MNPENPQIAILGLGSRSTLFYIEELNTRYQKQLGNYHTFPCLLYNIDFNTINPFLPDRFDVLVPQLTLYLNHLFTFPINHCIIPNITLHQTYDSAQLKHPILHPIKLVIDFIKNNEIENVTIIGSKYSMEGSYISAQLKEEYIQTYIPKAEDIEAFDTLRQKIYNRTETFQDIEKYKTLINHYSKQTHILIACTELSILHQKIQSNNRVIDLALLQIEKVLTLSIETAN